MRTGIRFDPPEVTLTMELAWALTRAFGPIGAAAPGPADGAAAADAAERLHVASRIGSRTPRSLLEAEVGEEAAARLAERYRAAAALSVARRELCRQLGEVATAIDAPLILLKGAALEAAGAVGAGSRESGDVDVLTLASRAEALQRALVAAGFAEQPIRTPEHELAPLYHASGLLVEVHRFVRGVRLDDDRPATGDDLLGRELCRSGSGELGKLWLPEPRLLLAHALVHGIAQHGAAPASYPPFRMISDVADLGFGSDEWRQFVGQGWPWIARDVSLDESEAVWQLARRLGRGDDPREVATGAAGAARMLRHLVGGVVDPDYRRSLRILQLTDPVAEAGRGRALARKVVTNLWLRREEIDAIYGPQPSALSYLAMRLWRPWDLAWQGLSSIRSRRNRS